MFAQKHTTKNSQRRILEKKKKKKRKHRHSKPLFVEKFPHGNLINGRYIEFQNSYRHKVSEVLRSKDLRLFLG